MEIEVTVKDQPVVFTCEPTLVSRWVCDSILTGLTYPDLPFVDDVRVIWDAGANCGAASVYFAHHHPDAAVHAFEPASGPRQLLERNVADLANVTVHSIGLSDTDHRAHLYLGDGESILGSFLHRDVNCDETEEVDVRAAGRWAVDHDIDRIDLLKVDIEGLETSVLTDLAPLLPTVKVLYVEYDSRADRRAIDDLVRSTHQLYFTAAQFMDQGEIIYLRNDYADHPEATPFLRELASRILHL